MLSFKSVSVCFSNFCRILCFIIIYTYFLLISCIFLNIVFVLVPKITLITALFCVYCIYVFICLFVLLKITLRVV